jgi:hypothetical protein
VPKLTAQQREALEFGGGKDSAISTRAKGIVAAAWQEARKRGGRSTIGAVALSLGGAALAFVILNRSDVGSLIVQIALAALALLVFFVSSLVVIAARIERSRDAIWADFDVLQRRAYVATIMRQIITDCRLVLAQDDPGPVENQKILEFYVERALSAARSDRFVNAERTRELEAFLEPSADEPRQRFYELEQLLTRNLYEGVYLRP